MTVKVSECGDAECDESVYGGRYGHGAVFGAVCYSAALNLTTPGEGKI